MNNGLAESLSTLYDISDKFPGRYIGEKYVVTVVHKGGPQQKGGKSSDIRDIRLDPRNGRGSGPYGRFRIIKTPDDRILGQRYEKGRKDYVEWSDQETIDVVRNILLQLK